VKCNKTKHLLRAGRPAVGTFCFLPEPGIVDIAGLAGFDFVIIDNEHSGKDFQAIEAMVRAAEVVDMTPLVRVPEADEKTILQMLELGAQGIVVPYVNSPDKARLAAQATRYPPEGIRGTCRSTRAASYGLHMSRFAEHMRTCNEELLLVGLIEDKKGVEQIDAILAEGLDVCFLGRADLSSSLGFLGQLDHPEVAAAVAHVLAAVKRRDCVAGNAVYSAAEAKKCVDQGYRFLVYATDTQILMNALQSAAEKIRQAIFL
jgi:2-keto-3-deoxy-L-rhamnonate aldolase RhmA